jgi:uncharacterized tellurite resistance protein B-like protein
VYTYELAALHLQLLFAMAAVDDEVMQVEVEEVLAFIDRASMREEDVARLEQLARASLAVPPSLDDLTDQLGRLAKRPSIARLVADDLARVAAADACEDPRETRMLAAVCDVLGVPTVEIRVEHPEPKLSTGSASRSAPTPRVPRLVTQHRARVAVRKALESSYREEAGQP